MSFLDCQGESEWRGMFRADKLTCCREHWILLILKAVSLGPLHGYGVLLRIQQISGEELVIQQGSLYPALYRLEHQGAIASEWGESENNRKAKFYKLTREGRQRLGAETAKWNRMAGIIGTILSTTPEEA